MDFDTLLYDAEMEASEFAIVRKTWTHLEGYPQLVDLEEIFACGILHPADPTRMDLLPEENRHAPLLIIHSTEPLSLGETQGDTWTAPDEIHWEGKVYRVFQVRPWECYGFWKGWAVEI